MQKLNKGNGGQLYTARNISSHSAYCTLLSKVLSAL